MNLELLDPFAKTVPDHVDSVLSYGVEDATVCCFGKRGAYLAVGYATGIVVIWDFVTRGIGRVVEAHARAITALSWARGGRRLLSASHDQRLHYWALEPPRPELIRVICLDSPIMSALMLPGKYPRAMALTADGVAHVVDIKENTADAVSPAAATIISPPSAASSAGNPSPAKKPRPAGQAAAAAATANHGPALPAVLCLALDRRASRVCLGTCQGQVLSVGTKDGDVSASMTVAGCAKVKQMDLSRDGKWMLVNGGERVIRMLERESTTGREQVKQMDLSRDGKWMLVNGGERVIRMLERESTTGRSVRDFQDVVNRTRWQCCRFTGDSEYIAGGSRAEGTCSIYLWTIEGHLVTRLEGPNLGLLSLTRHPVRPFLAAALTNGKVQLWGTTPIANWTAFAADFEELEENVEYVEKEDEFDVVVEEGDPEGTKRKAEKEKQEEEEAVVSIDAIDTVDAWSTDSEGEDRLQPFYLSTEPGAAAREGWYDLDVQTSKRGISSKPGGGRWEDKEEWTSVRTGDGGGGKKGGGGAKKKKPSNREFGKRGKSHAGKNNNQAPSSKARAATDAPSGSGRGGGGSSAGGDATAAAAAAAATGVASAARETGSGSHANGKGSGGGGGGSGGDTAQERGRTATPPPPFATAPTSPAKRLDGGGTANADANGSARGPAPPGRSGGGSGRAGAEEDGSRSSGERHNSTPAASDRKLTTVSAATDEGGPSSAGAPQTGPVKRPREEEEQH